jgi:hypothetical protein
MAVLAVVEMTLETGMVRDDCMWGLLARRGDVVAGKRATRAVDHCASNPLRTPRPTNIDGRSPGSRLPIVPSQSEPVAVMIEPYRLQLRGQPSRWPKAARCSLLIPDREPSDDILEIRALAVNFRDISANQSTSAPGLTSWNHSRAADVSARN